jgi:hypothetical protein
LLRETHCAKFNSDNLLGFPWMIRVRDSTIRWKEGPTRRRRSRASWSSVSCREIGRKEGIGTGLARPKSRVATRFVRIENWNDRSDFESEMVWPNRK